MTAPAYEPERSGAARPSAPSGGHGHGGWAMLLCCIPMIVAVVLIVLGR